MTSSTPITHHELLPCQHAQLSGGQCRLIMWPMHAPTWPMRVPTWPMLVHAGGHQPQGYLPGCCRRCGRHPGQTPALSAAHCSAAPAPAPSFVAWVWQQEVLWLHKALFPASITGVTAHHLISPCVHAVPMSTSSPAALPHRVGSPTVQVVDLGAGGKHFKSLRGAHANIASGVAFRAHRPWEVLTAGMDMTVARWVLLRCIALLTCNSHLQ